MMIRINPAHGVAALMIAAGLASTAVAAPGQIGDAEEFLLEFFAPQNFVNGDFSGVYVNSAGDVGVLGGTFGNGTTVTINRQTVFTAASSDAVSNGNAPDQMGISIDGGWAYHTFDGNLTNQVVATDAGVVLSEGQEFLTGLFAADTVFGVRMADNGDIFASVDIGDAVGNDTDRAIVRIRNHRTAPTFDIIAQGGTTVAGTDVGGGLNIGSNSTNANLRAAGGFATDYNVSQNGRYLILETDVQGAGITSTNDTSVVLFDLQTGTQSVVLREGTPTGGGDNFDNLGFSNAPVAVNNLGSTLIAGDTDGDTATDGFVAFNGDIIARQGDTADGFVLDFVGSIALNNLDQHVSVWRTDSVETLFFGQGDGPLEAIISVGDTFTYFDTIEGEFLEATIDDINTDQIALTDDGIAYINVDFTDGVGFSDFNGIIAVRVIPTPSAIALLPIALAAASRRRR